MLTTSGLRIEWEVDMLRLLAICLWLLQQSFVPKSFFIWSKGSAKVRGLHVTLCEFGEPDYMLLPRVLGFPQMSALVTEIQCEGWCDSIVMASWIETRFGQSWIKRYWLHSLLSFPRHNTQTPKFQHKGAACEQWRVAPPGPLWVQTCCNTSKWLVKSLSSDSPLPWYFCSNSPSLCNVM